MKCMYTQSAQNSHVAGSQTGQFVPSWTHALMLHVSKLPVCLFAELRVWELPCQHWPHRGHNCYRQIEKTTSKMCIPLPLNVQLVFRQHFNQYWSCESSLGSKNAQCSHINISQVNSRFLTITVTGAAYSSENIRIWPDAEIYVTTHPTPKIIKCTI